MVGFNTNLAGGLVGAGRTGQDASRSRLILESQGGVANPLQVKSLAQGQEIFEVAQTSRQEELGQERRGSVDLVRDRDQGSRNIQDEILLSRDAQDFLEGVRKNDDSVSLVDDLAARRAGADEARAEAQDEEFLADIDRAAEVVDTEVESVVASATEQRELRNEITALFGGGPVAQESNDGRAALRDVRNDQSTSREEQFVDSAADNDAAEQNKIQRDQAANVAQRDVQDEITARDTQSVRGDDSDVAAPPDDSGRPEVSHDAVAAPPPGGEVVAPPTASGNSEQNEQATGVPSLDIVA